MSDQWPTSPDAPGPPGSQPETPPPPPGWWQASDGNWYPPHTAPGGQTVPPPPGAPGFSTYGYPVAAQSTGTNGLAIASLVLGILWLWWVGSILAVIFGHIAMSQIKRTGQSGRGLALAGAILGYIGIAFFVLLVVVIAVGADSSSSFSVGNSIN